MADSYSVKAILSATDSGFSSTLKNAMGIADSFGAKLKSGFNFGILTGMGQQFFSAVTSGVSGMVSEIDSSNAAWKTFEGNMNILGKSTSEISAAKKELQAFAEQTVYSSSDMAQTYAQLEAVGTKNTTQLVKGFGGLAAAAENPQQAMKTLSQQATQMAAKPTVAWADFKLMLEQTPAGMAAVAKSMGMTSAELVTAIQAGEVKTEDFFAAIQKVGTSDSFSKLATQYKTVGQAMDGLQETVGNKLTPAFDVLSQIGINAISGIADKLGALDGNAIADKVSGWVAKATPYWNSFSSGVTRVWGVVKGVWGKVSPLFESAKTVIGNAIETILVKMNRLNVPQIVDSISAGIDTALAYWDMFKSSFSDTGPAISDALGAVKDAAVALFGAFSGTETISNFGTVMDGVAAVVEGVAGAIEWVAGVIEDNADIIAKCTPWVIGLVAAFKGFKIVSAVLGPVASFGKSLASMVASGVSGLASKLFGIGKAQESVGKSSASSAKQMLASAKSFMMIGAGVLLIAAGFALLAQSAIALSNAGGLAIGVMAGLVVAVAALSLGFMAMLKSVSATPAKMTAAATAMLALGAAVLLIGVGFALMAQSSIALANAGGLAIGVMVGMVAVVALLAVGAAALGTALSAGAIGFVAFGAAVLLVGAGLLIAAAGVNLLVASFPMLVQYGAQAALIFAQLGLALSVFAVGAALAGVAALTLGAGLLVVAVGVAAAAVAVLALGAGVLVLGAGLVVAAAGLMLFTVQLPTLAAYGSQCATIILSLPGALTAFGAGAMVAGSGCLVLAAGLLAVAAGLTLVAAGAVLAAAGVLALSAGVIVLAAGVTMLAATLTLLGASLTLVAAVLPTTASGALAVTAGFTALLAASLALTAALIAVEIPLALVGVTALASSAGVLAFGVAMTTAAVGALAMDVALAGVSTSMSSIADDAKSAESSLDSMLESVNIVESGLDALGDMAESAMDALTGAFKGAASDAKAAATELTKGYSTALKSGLATTPAIATTSVSAVAAALRAGRASAYQAGAYISMGFAQGMLSQLAVIRSAAAQMAAAADAALRAKAKIASPSKVSTKLGSYWGEGFVNGIAEMTRDAWRAAEDLVSTPSVNTPKLAMAYAGELSSEYDYHGNREFAIEVPLSIDGREVGKASAKYTMEEIDKQKSREDRKHGKV